MAKVMPQHTGVSIGSNSFPDSDVQVNDILRWISTDSEGKPVFVEQNGKLVVRFAFTKSDGTEGPPCSATPTEFWLIVKALGVDISNENPKTRHTAEALNRALKALNERSAKTSITVPVKNGWVNGDNAAGTPPEGKYTIKFTGARRLDRLADDYHFSEFTDKRTGKLRRTLIFNFEIAGNGRGKPTIYDGYNIEVWFDDGFTDIATDSHGNTIQAVHKGHPLFGRTAEGRIAPEAPKWEAFGTYFAPSLQDHDWVVDPNQSTFGVCEVLEPQYVYVHRALADNRRVVMNYRLHRLGKKPNLDWNMQTLAFDNEPDDIQVEEDKPSTTLTDLVQFIEATWKDITVFDLSPNGSNDLLFTEDGKKWAKDFMGGDNGPWVQAGLNLADRKPLNQLSEDELVKLYAAFKKTYGKTEEADW